MLLCSFSLSWANNDDLTETEEERIESLKIKSMTKLYSADYHINGGDEEEDRKRTDIGIGEEIRLLLTGKPKGNIRELTWLFEGDGFNEKQEDLKGDLLITLTAKTELTKDTSVKVTAETNEGQQATITINIKIPTKVEGKKIEGIITRHDGTSFNTDDYKRKQGEHSLIGFIQLTLLPTNVNFTKIQLIERDDGLEWPDMALTPKPVLATGHTGNGAHHLTPIMDKNLFYDVISDIDDLLYVLNTIRNSRRNPQEFWWKCSAYVYLEATGKDSILVSKTNQTFSIEALFKQIATNPIIKKFGLTFERNSNDK